LAAEVGLGWTVAQKGAPFVRTRARWQGLWPLSGERSGRLAVRMEGGAVIAKTTTPVPESQLFFTGGDQSVRGYKLRGIGVPQSDGSINPGRLLTVASLEWQRPIWSNGSRTPWESTLFVDVGSVGNQVSDLSPKTGIGAGVRYNSPVGPLQLDAAYGLDTRRLRLHMSVGFAF
jgi:translocation and assembly module TamA